MKHKLLIICITLLFATSLTSAELDAKLVSDQPTNMTLQETQTLAFDLSASNTSATITGVSLVDHDAADFSFSLGIPSSVDTPGELDVNIEAPETEAKENITVQFEGEENGSTVSDTVSFQAQAEEPLYELYNGWINSEQEFTANGETYTVDDIESSLFLKDSSDTIHEAPVDEQTELKNTEYVDVHQTVTGETLGTQVNIADITVLSEQQDASFEISDVQSQQACNLNLELRTGSKLNRGQQNIFVTVNKETGDAVPQSEVIITQQDGGEVVDTFTTDQYGRHTYTMPDKVESDSLIFSYEYLGDKEKFSECTPSERVIQFDQTYQDWLQQEETFQLNMKLNESMINDGKLYGNITGLVTNKDGEPVENAVLEVEGPSNEEIQISGTTFNYQPSSTGEYDIRLKKSSYLGSEAQTVNYQDQCQSIDGTVGAKGCEEKEIFMRFENADGEPANQRELTPDEQYNLFVQDETGETLNQFEDSMDVLNSDGEEVSSIEFQEGQARVSFTGEGEISYNGSNRYESFETTVSTGSNDSGISNMWLIIGGGIFGLLIIILGILYALGGEGGTSRNAPTQMSASGGAVTPDDGNVRLSGGDNNQ